MAAPEETALRLLAGIEEFTVQVALALGAGDCRTALAIQYRGGPLITQLCRMGAAGSPRGWGPAAERRLESILSLRRACQERINALRAHLTAERIRLAASRRRLQALAPAYGSRARAGRTTARLNAAV